MGVSLTSMVAQARLDSGLRNNRFFSNLQIAGFLSDALSDLRDKMIARFAYWFKSEYPFTLTSGAGNNILDLSEIPDLEMIQGLNLIDASGNPRTVDMLGSFAERNQYAANWPFATGGSFYGAVGRKYWPDGNDLEVLPASNAAGNYVLVYTPQAQTFLERQSDSWDIGTSASLTVGRSIVFSEGDHVDGATRIWTFANGRFEEAGTVAGAILTVTTGLQTGPFTVEAVISDTQIVTFETPITETFEDGDSFSVNDVLQLSFPDAEFTEDMESGTVTTAYSVGPPDNSGLNGTFEIFEVMSATTVQIPVWLPSASITNPTAGTVSVSWQPAGTINELPAALTPWSYYLVLLASIRIRTGRRQPLGDLSRQLERFERRIVALTKQRGEGVRQAPVTRTNYGSGRGGFWDV